MNQACNDKSTKYDLEERTAKFAEEVINFVRQLAITPFNRAIIDQLIRSATSIGANYCEADDSESKKDFKHKIGICKKESRETKHWLRMLAVVEPDKDEKIKILWQETKELNLIFNAINNKLK